MYSPEKGEPCTQCLTRRNEIPVLNVQPGEMGTLLSMSKPEKLLVTDLNLKPTTHLELGRVIIIQCNNNKSLGSGSSSFQLPGSGIKQQNINQNIIYQLENPALPRVLIVTPVFTCAWSYITILAIFPQKSRTTQLRISNQAKSIPVGLPRSPIKI